MANPYAIQVHCDGAMDYDSKQTGGNGFIIEFPESIGLDSITRAYRNDEQGIHRLEMISVLEAMEELLAFEKKNPGVIRKAAGIEIFTDRLRATDSNLTNPYRIRDWRRNKWENYEGKAIKDNDVLDKIDKARAKLSRVVGGRVSIQHVRENKNRVADKLAERGKRSLTRGRKILNKKKRHVMKRLYTGPDVKYASLEAGVDIEVREYAWERVGEQYEICFEVCSGNWEGFKLKAYVDGSQKGLLHRGHFYRISLAEVFNHHVTISEATELPGLMKQAMQT